MTQAAAGNPYREGYGPPYAWQRLRPFHGWSELLQACQEEILMLDPDEILDLYLLGRFEDVMAGALDWPTFQALHAIHDNLSSFDPAPSVYDPIDRDDRRWWEG